MFSVSYDGMVFCEGELFLFCVVNGEENMIWFDVEVLGNLVDLFLVRFYNLS